MVMQRSPTPDTFGHPHRPLITVATVALWLLAVAAAVAIGVLGGQRDSGTSHGVKPSPITVTTPEPDPPTVQGQWTPLTWDISDALAEGADDPSTIPTPHDDCLMYVTKDWGVTVVCPDGSVITQ